MSAAREGRALRPRSVRSWTAAILPFAVLSCGAPDPERTEREDGRSHRIVSLVPAASGILVALGAADLVVGRTDDDETSGLEEAATVGRVLTPDRERIAALRPTAVLAWAGADLAALGEAVEPGGAALLPLRLERVEDVRAGILDVADAIGRRRAGERLAARIDAHLERVERSVAEKPPVATVWVVWAEPPVVAGGGTLPDDLLRLTGGRNLFADAGVPWPRPSREALLAARPKAVVWPLGPGMPDPAKLSPDSPWRAWPEARFIRMDGDLVHEAGARVAEAAAALAAGLHADPDASDPTTTAAAGGPQR